MLRAPNCKPDGGPVRISITDADATAYRGPNTLPHRRGNARSNDGTDTLPIVGNGRPDADANDGGSNARSDEHGCRPNVGTVRRTVEFAIGSSRHGRSNTDANRTSLPAPLDAVSRSYDHRSYNTGSFVFFCANRLHDARPHRVSDDIEHRHRHRQRHRFDL